MYAWIQLYVSFQFTSSTGSSDEDKVMYIKVCGLPRSNFRTQCVRGTQGYRDRGNYSSCEEAQVDGVIYNSIMECAS